jgi:hypothetical protein
MEPHCTWRAIFLEQGATKAKVFAELKNQKFRQITEG